VSVLVQKYGGSSVDGPERIRRVAARVAAGRRRGIDTIVVVSAMGRTTDEMHQLARAVSPNPPQRELDMLVTAGERIAMSLLAMAIHREGCEAISFTGSQSGIITDCAHGNARIKDVRAFRIRDELARGRVVIVAGYQGVSEAKEVTTLGRGGSDLTAVALACAFSPSRCELCKDVDGVLTLDPRHARGGRRLHRIPAEAMLALARAGSSVVHDVAVEYAIEHAQPLVVRSSFHDRPGTEIVPESPAPLAAYGTAVRSAAEGFELSLVAGEKRLDALGTAALLPGGREGRRTAPLTMTWVLDDLADVARSLASLRDTVLDDEPHADPAVSS
jgi:aspartate kinase